MMNKLPNNQIISYHLLRMLIGIIGVALPLIVIVGQWILGGFDSISNSISASYYNQFRNILVGSLFVLGFFLLSYRGKDGLENWFANSGFVFSLGIALFPCEYEAKAVRNIHNICAGALFLMFALFSLWLFRKSTKEHRQNIHLKRIDNVYVITGIILVLCIIALCVFVFLFGSENYPELHNRYKPILFIETIGLISFAYAWMTRAHFLWRDRAEYPSRWYMFGKTKTQ